MAGATPERLLGVRDAFVRYFHQGLQRPISVAVVPQAAEETPGGLPLSDEETIALARRQACELKQRLGSTYHFYVASEGGVHSLEAAGEQRSFIRNWTVVIGPMGEAWGGSGAIQLPDRLLTGFEGMEVPASFPGTRRRGGIISSLSGGLETRRSAVALSTFNALATLFYGVLQSRSMRAR